MSDHASTQRLDFLAAFEFKATGIRMGVRQFPILMMEWVEGKTLDAFVRENAHRPTQLRGLADQWIKLTRRMREAQIAHGDLQHGNIIVSNGRLRLVDFDGTYVPALKGMKAQEYGHPNYQHPRRADAPFDERLVRFSSLVIFCNLLAVAERPQLGAECEDRLFLMKEDLDAPSASPRLASLRQASDSRLRKVAEALTKAAGSSPADSVILDELVPEGSTAADIVWGSDLAKTSPSPGTNSAQPTAAGFFAARAAQQVTIRSTIQPDRSPRRAARPQHEFKDGWCVRCGMAVFAYERWDFPCN